MVVSVEALSKLSGLVCTLDAVRHIKLEKNHTRLIRAL